MSLKRIASKNVVTTVPQESLIIAAKKMREQHVGTLVVTELRPYGEVPIGILTDRDIVVSTIALGVDPSHLLVEDVMTASVVCANESDSVFHLLSLFKEHGIRRVPLIDAQGALIGILSTDDLLPMLASEILDLSKVAPVQRASEKERRVKLV